MSARCKKLLVTRSPRFTRGECSSRRGTAAGYRRSTACSHGAGVVDLDLAVVLPDLYVRKGCERLAELLLEDITLQRERRAVARTVEASGRFVVPQEATLVRAHSGDRREMAVVVHDEADGRLGGERRDLTITDSCGVEDRLPGALVGHEFLRRRDRR